MRRFAVSDIHGCAKSFRALMGMINFSKKDELYILGDLIDRGPDSKGVVDYIWELEEEGHQVFCIRGNHDQMLLDAQNDMEWHKTWKLNGGDKTMQSFGVDRSANLPKKYLDFFSSLPFYLEVAEYVLVHAGFSFNLNNPFDEFHSMLWRKHQWYDRIDRDWLGDRIILHGHVPKKKNVITLMSKQLDQTPVLTIDNGCVFNKLGLGRLCAFEMTHRELYFQDNVE